MSPLHRVGSWAACYLLSSVYHGHTAAASTASPDTIAAIDYWQFPASSCPPPCADFGIDPATWPLYHDANAQIPNCKETYLFQTNLYNTVDEGQNIHYRACTGTAASSPAKRQLLAFNTSEPTEVTATINLASWTSFSADGPIASVSAAVHQLSQLQQSSATARKSKAFLARAGNVVAGMFVGVEITPSSIADITDAFLEHAISGLTSQQAAQVCDISSELSTATQIFGIVIDTTGNVAAVQSALASWNNATCVSGSESNSELKKVSLRLVPGDKLSIVPSSSTPVVERSLVERATCQYLEVESGDSCSSLASSCGISLSTFESYNSGVNCNDLQLNTYVCCTAGTPPNFEPQPYSNGTCYTYAVESGDYCYAIATAHNITTAIIENSNNNTWGWSGCSDLFVGQTICLSSGNPPYPANVPNSVCGPQVNGTVFPANYTSWADLNPCPLNACCDIYGQCGIDADFCTPSESSTGAPGTAAVGSNGCISNCGTEIVASGPPSQFKRMGYFEAFDNQRPCLNMPPSDIPSTYDNVHFAFANITSSFDVDISGEADYFQQFLDTDGFNRILSFGGWAFSTDPSTYPIFRSGVTPANQLSFARNVANFIQSHNLQGVDFDWEYPGPSIITGIPSGSPEDGANYLAFLKTIRGILPSSYTISITAPASFYYLKNFPIEEMASVVDYIVYMTYDLHGQWDYGNQYTDPGCPAGDCLRSQINMTETQSAFSMITKAGVPANMIMVGQPLYGRSFQMTTAGCYTEECTFTGPSSGALPGACTDTAGYISNWEINQIITNSQYESSVEEYYSEVAGDILVYDSTQWVSWMKPSTYNARSSWAQGLNFGGTCDWAMDLNASYAANGSQIGEGSGVVYVPPSIYSSASPTVTCLPPCTFVFPPWTLSTATTISIPATTMTLSEVWPEITTSSNGVTATVYVTATTVTTVSIPAITTSTISVWNVEFTNTATPTLYLTSSIIPPPVTLTQPNDKLTTTTLPGIVWTFAPGPYPPVSTSYPPAPHPPPGFGTGIVPVVIGPPAAACAAGCGALCALVCDPVPPCIGICGCIGLGCPDGTGSCVGPSCGEGSDDGDDGDEESSTTCATSSTVTDCAVGCSITNYGDTSTASNCFTTSCSRVVGCQSTGTTTTTETTTAICANSTPLPGIAWEPVSGASLPVYSNGEWSTPGGPPPTSTNHPTTTTKATSVASPSKTTSSSAPPTSASPSSIIFFSDSKCQNLIGEGTYSEFSQGCFVSKIEINSYIVGTTNDCGCPTANAFCEWDTFVITTSSGCGYDDEVGGGCSGGGGQSPNQCYQTSKAATYFTGEVADNGVCKRSLLGGKKNETDSGVNDDGRGLFARGGEEMNLAGLRNRAEEVALEGLARADGRKVFRRC